MNNYLEYRGKCKELSEEAVRLDPTLTLVRGFYHCPIWGKQPHWWTKKPDGEIYDPTKLQFQSGGLGEYEEFDGFVECAECWRKIKETEARFDSNYAFCSDRCNMRFVGL